MEQVEFGGENVSSALEPPLQTLTWLLVVGFTGGCERARGRNRELSDPKQFGHALFLREWCFCHRLGAKKTPSVVPSQLLGLVRRTR